MVDLVENRLYSAWCMPHHSSPILSTLPGILVAEENEQLAIAKFLFFCKARCDAAMATVMQDCAVNLQLTSHNGGGTRTYQFDYFAQSIIEV